jgi:hypothetical protein
MRDLIPASHELCKLSDLIVAASNELQKSENLRFFQPLVEFERAIGLKKAIFCIVLKADQGIPEVLLTQEPNLPDRETDKAHVKKMKGKAREFEFAACVVALKRIPQEVDVIAF